ncbi:MAG: exonuclease domain-containing protein [Flavobacteriia bacterium]
MHYVVVDIETTGGTPKSSKITEIAMYKTDGKEIIDEYVTLLDPEMPIPEFIVRLTGISDKMVENAPKFYEVAKKIIDFSEGCIFVAHNVSFDYTVIRHEFKSLGFDYRMPHLCTVRASKHILPGHASYSLGKLARSLDIEINGRHRAGGDALATTIIFNMLHAKGEKNLEKFITHEVNPKKLHPNLDLEFLDNLPNKTGIYKFYNDANQLIYIGKSKHIKKRVDQHLKNNSTKKGIEMQQEVYRIEYELTGSELIALLLESQLIKNHKPIHNRQLRKELFPFGLYSYENEQGYINLYIEKTAKKTDLPYTTFTTKAEAVSFLTNECKKYTLCQKYCNLYQTKTSCFDYQVKQCFGACIEKENPENYNSRVQLFLEKLKFEHENFFILEGGINRNEKMAILIQNGAYRGYGKIPYYAMNRAKEEWHRFIEIVPEDKDARTIIKNYLRTISDLNLVVF